MCVCYIWLTKTKKETKKMTPSEIATDITAVNSSETVGQSTNFTYSFGRMDDANTWDR